MGIIRRNKRKKIREARKLEPCLKLLLFETESMIKHTVDEHGNVPSNMLKSTMDFINIKNKVWQSKCVKNDVVEIIDAYVDGVSRIKTMLKYADRQNTDKQKVE